MNWEAANAPKAQVNERSSDLRSDKRRSTETVEAALSRLSKAYTTSMECIGSLNITNKMIQKEKSNRQDATAVLVRVSNVGRTTFETAILTDPLVMDHAPTLYREFLEMERPKSVTEKRPDPPVISSAAHKATIRELAYLSLVNYSDLLLSCSSHNGSSSNDESMLDRGVVRKLKSLANKSCWSDESVEDTQRLALAALCDASNLDASDPILWLKLACAARGLERTVHQRNDSIVLATKYRRIQRHALERGSTALPLTTPPNRAISRALKELDESTIDADDYKTAPLAIKEEPVQVLLELPRYSWSIFGRMLVRAWREGADFQTDPTHHSSAKLSFQFGSPAIALRLNPMFVLPPKLLGRICGFLDMKSVVRFESTCRFALISARASTETESVERNPKAGNKQEKAQAQPDESEKVVVDSKDQANGKESADSKDQANGKESAEIESEKNEKNQVQSHRTSKRLLSQMITSGKIAERSANRKSFDYCFLAATLSCTKTEYYEILKEAKSNNSIGQDDASPFKHERASRNSSSDVYLLEARERLSAASLGAFVEKWSGRNSGPADLLMKFLAHIAMNVQEVFISDPRGPLELTSCILTAFDLCMHRSGCRQGLEPQFFKPVEKTGSIETSLELFAVDLLHCELILKQCERYVPTHVEFDDDSNMITLMVAALLEARSRLHCSVKGNTHIGSKLREAFVTLCIRCNWVATGFFLWRSRITRVIFESIEAEDEGINFIEETVQMFDSPLIQSPSIKTPHLVSPGRTESHWKEISPALLTKFRDEIQASSVVSLAKQKFQEFVGEVDQNRIEAASGPVPADSAKTLADIGESLFERYKSSHSDPGAKHIELVEDFLTVHGGDLYALVHPAPLDEEDDERISDPVPVQAIELQALLQLSSPSILTILATCLNVSGSHRCHVAQLLVRLVLTTIDLHGSMMPLNSNTQGKGDDHDEESFSDSDDDSVVSDDGSGYRNAANKNADEKRARQCRYLVIFLLDRIRRMVFELMDDAEKVQFSMSDDCVALISCTIEFSKGCFHGIGRRWALSDDTTEKGLFKAVLHVVEALRTGAPESRRQYIDRVCFIGMVKTVVSHSPPLLLLAREQGNRVGKSARQKLCLKRAELLGMVFSELGYMLSKNLGKVQQLRMSESDMFSGGAEASAMLKKSAILSWEEKALFSDAVLSLWKYASMALSDDDLVDGSTAVCSTFDRPIVKLLQIPIGSAIVGFCGSATETRESTGTSWNQSSGDPLCLSEFFDSDASGNEWLSDGEESDAKESKTRKKELLRAICHAVHCINVVMGVARDKEAISTFSNAENRDNLGPLLPLVTTRVLNYFAESLLLNFGQESATQKEDLWVEEYPYTTRTTGELLDSLLRKSYRWLYGFSLVGEKAHQSAGKDSGSTTTTSDLRNGIFQPEGTSAAAQLYRCIVRAYAGGRRSPPKAALEVVSSALPPLEESEESTILREFMFSVNDTKLGLEGIARLIEKGEDWNAPFRKIESHLAPSNRHEETGTDESYLAYEIMRVRRGISSELASGQVPMNQTDSGQKAKSDSSTDDERLLSSRHEEEISKKFFAIVDDLCLGDARNTTSWYRAAQCLAVKAELIADRLGLSKGFARNHNFSIPIPQPQKKKSLLIDALEAEQELEDSLLSKNWIQCLGNDLSVYARYLWSSFPSLVTCSAQISQHNEDDMAVDGDKNSTESIALREIEAMHRSGDSLKWQEAWGGIFVCALRKLALRFMCTALYIVQSNNETDADDIMLMSEICEMIGVALYSELMASQNYGYPMHIMAQKRKRQIAMVAKTSFQSAVDIVQGQGNDDDSENRETWDLTLLVGKCDEKIAGTYHHESYGGSPRKYEEHVASAMRHYSSALKEAEGIESDGGLSVSQQGGSSQGSTEVLYRMQASRLKCLISTVSQDEVDFERAEAEALRLTEAYWFKKPQGNETADESANTRDRVWSVFTDIVTGLAQCRLDHHFFHRSVFRHAQALMWAPILCDPTSREGSLGMVPATRSCTVRGLNNSTHAAHSAEVVMSALFDKKRSQLCAVWMTSTATSSPFQILNNSARKYDSLRGKYISAYIESLRLCNRRTELEQFMKSLSSSKRDFPNYFQASALLGGSAPAKSHANESLLQTDESLMSSGFLLSAKRQGNSAIADFILKSLSGEDTAGKKTAENNLKEAYACYLRLHCSEEDLKKTRAMKYGVATIREVEALCNAYLNTDHSKTSSTTCNDWSGGARKSSIFNAAVDKCRSLFPTLSGNFLFKNLNKPKQKDAGGTLSGNKRKKSSATTGSAKSNKVSFEVSVPNNLSAGDTFLTTVKLGENSTKKVKLTVPEGNPSTLRFSLKVPATDKPE